MKFYNITEKVCVSLDPCLCVCECMCVCICGMGAEGDLGGGEGLDPVSYEQ